MSRSIDDWPLSATRNTVEALEKRGLIAQAKGGNPLRILWKLSTAKPAGNTKRMTMRKKATHRKKR